MSNATLRRGAVAAAALAVSFTAAVVAAEQDSPRIVGVPGTNVVLELWEAPNANGVAAPHYAIALDGQGFSEARATSYELKLRHGDFDPLGLAEAPAIEAGFEAGEDTNLYIVQYLTPPLEVYGDAIADLGGEVLWFLANHSQIVKLSPEAVAEVEALPFVRWVGAYHPAYRLEPYMLDNAERAWEVYPWQRYNIMLINPDQAWRDAITDRIAELGGVVDRAWAGKFIVEATLTPEQLFEVIRLDEVLWVDRWSPMEDDMNNSREIGGANYVETVAGYTGQGVRAEVYDSGFNTSHVDFASRPLIVHGSAPTGSHGASTSGICFGDGTGNADARGLLPSGQGIVAAYSGPGLHGPARYVHSGELVDPAGPYWAVFQTCSAGDNRTTQYTTYSAEHDAIMFDFDILFCQSQSNAGDQMSRPQAWAKNIISGGGIYHYDTATKTDDCWCGGASIGPAADGRIKPDLCHFYDNILTTTSGSPTAYTSNFGGTSGATPNICGYTGLFFQMWSEGIFNNPVTPGATVFENRSHMTTAKAMMINTAEQYTFSGTGHDMTRVHQGWGMPHIGYMYDQRENMLIIDETELLTPLQSVTFNAGVSAGEPQLKVTLVFADPPGNPASSVARINDLTLKVVAPDGTVYWGNNGLLANMYSTPGGSANTVDTVENVFIENPDPGLWAVEVIADEINQDSHVETPALDADFALVISGAQPGPGFGLDVTPSTQLVCAPDNAVYTIDVEQFMGYTQPVTFSAANTPPGTTVSFSVNPVVPPGATVMTISDTAAGTPGEYAVTITGTAPDMERSTIVGLGLSTALPDQVVLTSPTNGQTEVGRQPTLAWQPAAQAIEYDLELADNPGFSNAYTATTGDTSHDVAVQLESLTTYYWHVKADNGCGDGPWSETFTFTTLEQPDYFTEFFEGGGFDLHNWTVELIPDGTGDYYRVCGYDATVLPTDPAGGTNLVLSDDAYVAVSPGTPVHLYGNAYTTFYVGSNGYVTFGSGDTTYSESLSNHFNQPRISGLFDDLNPSSGGTISWKATADRVAVTWQNVPEYYSTGANTFQIEMFFNGEIHITWTSITSSDSIVGLSNGGGVPTDYIETDFSAVGPCTLPCPADVNGDGVVDVLDLLQVLAAWGAAGGPEDINGDGIVDVLDLLELLAQWGACP